MAGRSISAGSAASARSRVSAETSSLSTGSVTTGNDSGSLLHSEQQYRPPRDLDVVREESGNHTACSSSPVDGDLRNARAAKHEVAQKSYSRIAGPSDVDLVVPDGEDEDLEGR